TPPQQYSTMHDFALPKVRALGAVAAWLRSAKNSGSDRPSRPAPQPPSICRRFSRANSLQLECDMAALRGRRKVGGIEAEILGRTDSLVTWGDAGCKPWGTFPTCRGTPRHCGRRHVGNVPQAPLRVAATPHF